MRLTETILARCETGGPNDSASSGGTGGSTGGGIGGEIGGGGGGCGKRTVEDERPTSVVLLI